MAVMLLLMTERNLFRSLCSVDVDVCCFSFALFFLYPPYKNPTKKTEDRMKERIVEGIQVPNQHPLLNLTSHTPHPLSLCFKTTVTNWLFGCGISCRYTNVLLRDEDEDANNNDEVFQTHDNGIACKNIEWKGFYVILGWKYRKRQRSFKLPPPHTHYIVENRISEVV